MSLKKFLILCYNLFMIDLIIIGAGMAGLTAAIYASRAGMKVLVLEEAAYGGQIINTLMIENWPGDMGVSGQDLMEKIYRQAKSLGAEIKHEEVESIKDGFIVKTDEGEYSCKAVIIATGTEPRKLDKKQLAAVGKRSVSYCATCDGALYKGKPVVVIGSGDVAKNEIKYLENIASKVYHIHHNDPIPEEAEAVFVATKRVPATEFLEGFVELDGDGYVVAGEDCRTSRDGVFVAGDCRTKQMRQLVTAAGDGAIAAKGAVAECNVGRGL